MPSDAKSPLTKSPLTGYTLAELRRRRSVKWAEFPPDVLPMRIAEMDTPLAGPIADALIRAVTDGDTGYATPGRLRELFAAFAGRRYGGHHHAKAMRLAPDVMSGIVEVLRVTTEPGDSVVVNTPGYPPYFTQFDRIGLRVVSSPLLPGPEGYRLDLNHLEHIFAAGAKAFLFCNPHNPTGTVFTPEELVAVAELAERHDVHVVADEILAPLVHPGRRRHVPFPSLDRPAAARSIGLVSASKAWNLAGLKAALIVPGPDAEAAVAAIDDELAEAAGLFGVLASEAAFADGEPWLDELLSALDANRRLLADEVAHRLPGVRHRPPDAGFTAWLDFRGLELPEDPAAQLLRTAKVGVSSGLRFSPRRRPGEAAPGETAPGDGFVRLNFATRPDLVVEAVERIAAALCPIDHADRQRRSNRPRT
ncbi:MalY/PatB family protein [Streptomyces hundungensis]|uniref:MalY/PatB family protein n=1 Tax=Streptomyces hundungensis TaxID=1077946 RepID=UPI0031EA067D